MEERCLRCRREMVEYHQNNALYFCNGTPDDPHPEYLISTNFVEVSLDELRERPVNEPKPIIEDKVIESPKI